MNLEKVYQDINYCALIIIGGDGSLLKVCSLFQNSSTPPILAFNAGKLGYLIPFTLKDVNEALKYFNPNNEEHFKSISFAKFFVIV